MISDTKNLFLYFVTKLFVLQQEIFLTARKDSCVKKRIIVARKKLFYIYIKKIFLGIRTHSCELVSQ